jgi:hypothetical protein
MAADVRRRASQASYPELQHRRGEITAEQLEEWERQNREFIAGRRTVRPSLPGSGGAA